ncbi:translocator protein-like [Neocloeon triangulifer]|uniref:translocator protein-like n=1 Tax=Neocloeon triangulifer TaxID=2078957 RepID=UPI00286F5863|nr:translocator protein-like [Neocloeon triangulifer]
MQLTWEAVAASILPSLGGFVSTPYTLKKIKTWYKTLVKPWWTPPEYVFGPVWTFLFTSMGFASYLVWRDGGGFGGEAKTALALYGAQLAINWVWSPIFFGMESVKGGFFIGALLWCTAGVASVAMARVNLTAGLLMGPYMMWLTLATSINFYLWRNNPPKKKKKNN